MVGHDPLLLQALLGVALSVELLGANQVLAQLQQRVLSLLELTLLSLVQFVLYL